MTPDTLPSDVACEPITDWLCCLRTPVVAVYAIRQSAGFVLLDSGVVGYERTYVHALAQIASCPPEDVRITEILLTHGHDDHTGSVAALKAITGATVRGPALDADVIEGRAARPDPRLREWEIPLFERLGRVAPAPPVTLDELVEDGDQLGWERPAQIVAAPGHTRGSVAVFLPDDQVLIAGDAIATMGGEPILGVFNVDPEQAAASTGSRNSTRRSSASATAPRSRATRKHDWPAPPTSELRAARQPARPPEMTTPTGARRRLRHGTAGLLRGHRRRQHPRRRSQRKMSARTSNRGPRTPSRAPDLQRAGKPGSSATATATAPPPPPPPPPSSSPPPPSPPVASPVLSKLSVIPRTSHHNKTGSHPKSSRRGAVTFTLSCPPRYG